MSDGSFPSSPPPPPAVSPIVSDGRKWWQNWWLITAACVILIVGAAALIASSGGDGDGDPTASSAPTAGSEPVAQPAATDPATDPTTDPGAPITPPTTDPPPDGTTPADSSPDGTIATGTNPADEAGLIAGAPAGSSGDRLAPVPAGEVADIGENWRLQVLGIVEDGTDAVLAENQFNEPPPDGARYTLVDVALGYYGVDDPANAFTPTISGVGAASVGLDEDCGVIPGGLDTFVDVFAGGVVRGTLCFVTTPSDAGTVQLYAKTGFDGPDVFLATSPPAEPAAAMPTLAGPQPGAGATPARLAPAPIGTPVDVGGGWTLTVTGPATDITDIVATENQFNAPPPDGFRFVGIDVEYRYDGDVGPVSPFEVTANVVGNSNVQLSNGCGVIPNPLDPFGDVFAGGAVSGALCFVTPVDDIGSLVFYASTSFDSDLITFATEESITSSG